MEPVAQCTGTASPRLDVARLEQAKTTTSEIAAAMFKDVSPSRVAAQVGNYEIWLQGSGDVVQIFASPDVSPAILEAIGVLVDEVRYAC